VKFNLVFQGQFNSQIKKALIVDTRRLTEMDYN